MRRAADRLQHALATAQRQIARLQSELAELRAEVRAERQRTIRDEISRYLRDVARIAAGTEDGYWSTRRGRGPPGYSEREWRKVAPIVPGAVWRGRWCCVAYAALDAYERARADGRGTPAPAPITSGDSSKSTTWSPEVAARKAGLRLAKTSARPKR